MGLDSFNIHGCHVRMSSEKFMSSGTCIASVDTDSEGPSVQLRSKLIGRVFRMEVSIQILEGAIRVPAIFRVLQ
jgi:hypothetical protein